MGFTTKIPINIRMQVKFKRVSYSEVLANQLQVMDPTAIALCRENRTPIVFSMSLAHML